MAGAGDCAEDGRMDGMGDATRSWCFGDGMITGRCDWRGPPLPPPLPPLGPPLELAERELLILPPLLLLPPLPPPWPPGSGLATEVTKGVGEEARSEEEDCGDEKRLAPDAAIARLSSTLKLALASSDSLDRAMPPTPPTPPPPAPPLMTGDHEPWTRGAELEEPS